MRDMVPGDCYFYVYYRNVHFYITKKQKRGFPNHRVDETHP